VIKAICDALARNLDLPHRVGRLQHEAHAVFDAVKAFLLDGNDDLAVLDDCHRAVVPHIDSEVVSTCIHI